MAKKNSKLAKEWWQKSKRDFIAARLLSENDPPIYDYAIFHCQQAAEKAIKCFLVYHGESISKVHKLSVLIEHATKYDEHINSRIGERDRLSRLAVETRYPNYGYGNIKDFNEARENAESFCEYIKSILSDEVTANRKFNAEKTFHLMGEMDEVIDIHGGW